LAIPVGQSLRVAARRDHVGQAVRPDPVDRLIEQGLTKVEDLEFASRAERFSHRLGVVAVAGTDLEHPLPRPGRKNRASRLRLSVGRGTSAIQRGP